MISNQRKPLSETNPALVFGLAIFLFVFGVATAGMLVLAPLVDSDSASSEAVVEDGGSSTPGGPVNVTIVARNLAFDKRTITASPGVDVTVVLDNQDSGVLHNIAFYTNRSASTKIYVGELTAGPGKLTEKFKAPSSAGNYFFRCDAHPDQMTGTFVVK
jgi:plastocyanin